MHRIRELMVAETAGDPISGLKWTHKTTEKIAAELRSLRIGELKLISSRFQTKGVLPA